VIVVGVACAVAVAVTAPPLRRPTASTRTHGDAEPRSRAGADLPGVLLEVAAQLTAGARPADAWSRALPSGLVGPGGAPTIADLMTVGTGLGTGRGDADLSRCTSVVVACVAADRLGAPLADVLQRLAAALAADQEAAAEVRAAVAGPRATARVLAWLPVLGLLVGMALGARPVAAVLGGGLGTTTAVLGAGLLLGGLLWTRALLRGAGGAP